MKHITVCICTYKRVHLLAELLKILLEQDTEQQFTYSILVADNDGSRSAEAVALSWAGKSPIAIQYCVEPRQNIALVRNKAVENATGDFVAFIDDDELPARNWLLTLFNACAEYGADGVLGPVMPRFDANTPRWVIQSKLYERPTYRTGLVIPWKSGRTGNVLLKKEIFADELDPFRPEFLTGEDQDFFRRMIANGRVFVWCSEAVAYEAIPPIRSKRAFMLKRALLRGAIAPIHPTFGFGEIAKSFVAIPLYSIALPFVLAVSHGRFMALLVKLFDHLGKLLACIGIRPVKEPYVTR